MHITFESELSVPPISKALAMLTDRASVCVEDIQYDKTKAIVELPMQRKDLSGFKQSILGELQPVYGQKTVRALLKIWHVAEMKFEIDDRLATDCNSCFTVLFGVKIDDHQLYLGSAEETRGKMLCQIRIRVKKFKIELRDELFEDFSFQGTG